MGSNNRDIYRRCQVAERDKRLHISISSCLLFTSSRVESGCFTLLHCSWELKILNSKNQIQIFVEVHLLSEVLQGKLKIIFYIKNVLDLKPRFEVFV